MCICCDRRSTVLYRRHTRVCCQHGFIETSRVRQFVSTSCGAIQGGKYVVGDVVAIINERTRRQKILRFRLDLRVPGHVHQRYVSIVIRYQVSGNTSLIRSLTTGVDGVKVKVYGTSMDTPGRAELLGKQASEITCHNFLCVISQRVFFQAWNQLYRSLGVVCAHTLGALDVCTMGTEGSWLTGREVADAEYNMLDFVMSIPASVPGLNQVTETTSLSALQLLLRSSAALHISDTSSHPCCQHGLDSIGADTMFRI